MCLIKIGNFLVNFFIFKNVLKPQGQQISTGNTAAAEPGSERSAELVTVENDRNVVESGRFVESFAKAKNPVRWNTPSAEHTGNECRTNQDHQRGNGIADCPEGKLVERAGRHERPCEC